MIAVSPLRSVVRARDMECGDLSPLFVRAGLFEANEKR